MRDLSALRRAPLQRAAVVQDSSIRRAAVAIVIRPAATGSQVLYMLRTPRESDPWSGQVAFPGGRRDPEDASDYECAVREAREEVGLRLDDAQHFELLGQLPLLELVILEHGVHGLSRGPRGIGNLGIVVLVFINKRYDIQSFLAW